VPLPIDAAARAYDQRRTDGFLAMPQAALAFQWSAQVRYVSDLRLAFNAGCLVIAERAFDRLSTELQQKVRSAAARALARVDENGHHQDQLLLGSLFARQGMKLMAASEPFRAAFYDAARTARAQLGASLVPRALLDEVTRLLLDYHAEHGGR
jgi:TRAP-type C4-dicarboxylate transport system substrate-binding protein